MDKPKKPKMTETTEIVRQPNIEIDYKAMIAQLVEDRIAEVMADKQNESFRPFFEPQEVAIEIKRRQTVAQRKKWVVYFEEWGCMCCSETDRPHYAIGMCKSCHARLQKRLYEIMRRLMAETELPEIGFKGGV